MSLVEPVPELNPEMMRPSFGEVNALPRVTEPSEEGSRDGAQLYGLRRRFTAKACQGRTRERVVGVVRVHKGVGNPVVIRVVLARPAFGGHLSLKSLAGCLEGGTLRCSTFGLVGMDSCRPKGRTVNCALVPVMEESE